MPAEYKIELFNMEQYLNTGRFPDPEPIVDGLLSNNELAILSGSAKAGKSMLAIDVARSVSTGDRFLGKFPCIQRNVILLQTEISHNMLHKRLKAFGIKSDNCHLYTANNRVKIDTSEGKCCLRNLLNEFQPCLLILDPFYTLHSGDENSSTAVAPVLSDLKELTNSYDCSILLIHHQGKRSEGSSNSQPGHKHRGSSSFADVPDMSISLSKLQGNSLQLSFECRNIKTPDDLKLIRDETTNRHQVIGELVKISNDDHVLNIIKDHQHISKDDLFIEFEKATQRKIRTLETCLKNLREKKLITTMRNQDGPLLYILSQNCKSL